MGKPVASTIEELDIGTPNQNGADADGILYDFEVPTTRQVCGCCNGEGSILNPNIGQHAYSAEEFAESFDEEERAEYFKGGRGIYGVRCPECDGRNVVDVPRPENIRNPVVRKAVEQYFRDEAAYQAQCRREREMGY